MKIDFNNTEVAFQNKTNFELRKAHLLFSSLAYPRLVNILKKLTEFALKIKLPIKGIIKATVYKQFVGGETILECDAQIDQLEKQHVGAILDYSAEGKTAESDFDYTTQLTIDTILHAKANSDVPFSVFKPSGLGRFELYEKVASKEELTAQEKEEWQRVLARYEKIAKSSKEHSIPVLIDAEESWIQEPIDSIVTRLMERYNAERALIFNTAQMYRWDRLDHLKSAVIRAKEKGYFYGIKIVRGAYMEKERARAAKRNYKDPIQPTKEATDNDFNSAIDLLLANYETVSTVVATHNAQSTQFCIDKMDEFGISKENPKVYMAQLYGMSDNLSMNVAHDGYNVVKYVPFGPLTDVMPYLFRRAEENTSVKGQTGRELQLIKQELQRRKRS